MEKQIAINIDALTHVCYQVLRMDVNTYSNFYTIKNNKLIVKDAPTAFVIYMLHVLKELNIETST